MRDWFLFLVTVLTVQIIGSPTQKGDAFITVHLSHALQTKEFHVQPMDNQTDRDLAHVVILVTERTSDGDKQMAKKACADLINGTIKFVYTEAFNKDAQYNVSAFVQNASGDTQAININDVIQLKEVNKNTKFPCKCMISHALTKREKLIGLGSIVCLCGASAPVIYVISRSLHPEVLQQPGQNSSEQNQNSRTQTGGSSEGTPIKEKNPEELAHEEVLRKNNEINQKIIAEAKQRGEAMKKAKEEKEAKELTATYLDICQELALVEFETQEKVAKKTDSPNGSVRLQQWQQNDLLKFNTPQRWETIKKETESNLNCLKNKEFDFITGFCSYSNYMYDAKLPVSKKLKELHAQDPSLAERFSKLLTVQYQFIIAKATQALSSHPL
jgi:hypothetical protein